MVGGLKGRSIRKPWPKLWKAKLREGGDTQERTRNTRGKIGGPGDPEPTALSTGKGRTPAGDTGIRPGSAQLCNTRAEAAPITACSYTGSCPDALFSH